MPSDPKLPLGHNVLTFDQFWRWLQSHPNCILGAGTADAMLYDDDDLHWHFGVEDDGTLLVQVIRGKQLLGELLIQPREVAYVQSESKGEEEFLFECIVEAEHERLSAWHFTLSHDYSPEEQPKTGRWVH